MSEKGAPVKRPRVRMNKRLYVVLVCFFISAVFWLLIALSHDYTTTVIYPVNYINLPGKKVVMNDLPTKIAVQLRTTGFKIMSFGLSKEQPPVEVDVAGSLSTSAISTDILAIPTQSFLTDFYKEIGKEITITGFKPDSIIFNFSDLTTKSVPVVLSYTAAFEKQFDTTGHATLNPAIIEVSGPPSVVIPLQSVTTEHIALRNLKTTAKGKVKLISNRLLSYSVQEVEYTIPVEKFTEGSVMVDVHPVNVPAGYSLKTFPDKVKVRYMVALSKYNDVEKSMFDALVDGSDLDKKQVSKLDVNLLTFPPFVKVSVLEPAKVDYILRRQ